MKKFFIGLTALFMIAATLFSAGCDSGHDTNSSNSPPQQTSTSQNSTKYPPATTPTQSTQQSSDTSATQSTQQSSDTTATQSTQQSSPPTTPDIVGGISKEDITDEKMSELITQKYLSIHPNSRPGYKLEKIKNIVIHYVANPRTSALQNWKYFENKNNVSAHFIIDLDGSILQCMPLDEVAWAIGTQEGNYTTISIECCHPDSTGKFTDATYESLVKLVSWLCQKYNFTTEQVKRHYDYPRTNSSGIVWHKSCPLYFVDHPEKWENFKNELLIQ